MQIRQKKQGKRSAKRDKSAILTRGVQKNNAFGEICKRLLGNSTVILIFNIRRIDSTNNKMV